MKLIKQIISLSKKERDRYGNTYYRAKEGEKLIDELEFSSEKDLERLNICPHCGEELYCQSCGKKMDHP